MSEIKLYGYCTSPYVRKAGAFLYYKGLDFTHTPVNPLDPASTIGFTDGTQVPVVSVGDDWKRDSTPIGLWLDALFPDKPLVPADPEARAKVMAADAWASDVFLRSIFRAAMEPADTLDYRFRFWRLAALVSSQTPLPEEVRHNWPNFVPNAPFIQAMKAEMDLSESAGDMARRIAMELVGHIGEGPFIAGQPTPGLVDLAIFPNVVFGFMAGLEDQLSAAALPPIAQWISNVAAHLPDNPILVPDGFLVRRLSEAGLPPPQA